MQLKEETKTFYLDTMRLLDKAQIPFLVAGAYALTHYTGITRHTKDFDVFMRESDVARALKTLEDAGYKTELTFPHWLGKAYKDDYFIDIIYRSGNGVSVVDDAWFDHAVEGEALGVTALLCPVEEIIWTKAFIMERERYDGADVAHLLRACADDLDWERFVGRFEGHERVLLVHLLLFGFIYPGERQRIPEGVMTQLLEHVQGELSSPGEHKELLQGTLLSRGQYLIDLQKWGYKDARLEPYGNMRPEDAIIWTHAIEES